MVDGTDVLRGLEAEKRGDVNGAIGAYEGAIKAGFDGNHPFDRLAIMYRKQGKLSDEIRVLRRAIEIFERLSSSSCRGDVLPKLQKFRQRLKKTEERQATLRE